MYIYCCNLLERGHGGSGLGGGGTEVLLAHVA